MAMYDFDNNGIAKTFDGGKWYLINRDERRVSDGYTYIEEYGEGYYKAEHLTSSLFCATKWRTLKINELRTLAG